MVAFDTDIVTEILLGTPAYVTRAEKIPIEQQGVPAVVAEGLTRGHLSVIRRAEAGRGRVGIVRAYELFEQTFDVLRHVALLTYLDAAEAIYQQWRSEKRKGSTHDLRIAATCVAHSVTLVTRNRRDFDTIPGLSVEFWE